MRWIRDIYLCIVVGCLGKMPGRKRRKNLGSVCRYIAVYGLRWDRGHLTANPLAHERLRAPITVLYITRLHATQDVMTDLSSNNANA